MNNHVIDPTFFYDAIEEFSFDYVIYVLTQKGLDEYGKETYSYTKQTIRGSLQPRQKRLVQANEGNTTESGYDFYCKSLYRINIGDIIEYQHEYFRVNAIQNYDEFGCRTASLDLITLNGYRDLEEYAKYKLGVELV